MEGYTYESAAKELELILEELKNNNITIDQLSEKIEKAGLLMTFCKQKLLTTEKKVNEIIDNIKF